MYTCTMYTFTCRYTAVYCNHVEDTGTLKLTHTLTHTPIYFRQIPKPPD